jgi:hypothetical protein
MIGIAFICWLLILENDDTYEAAELVDRFKSTVIEADKYLREVSRYLHLNPVRGVVLGQGTN